MDLSMNSSKNGSFECENLSLKRKPTGEGDLDSPKKVKVDDVITKYDPSRFKIVSILRNDSRTKMLVLHCKYDETEDAIMLFQKSPFPDSVDKLSSCGIVASKIENYAARTILSNAEYHRLVVSAGFESVNDINVSIIHPAEEHHLDKYTASGRVIIQETPELYSQCVVPYLAKSPKDLSWVENILNGTTEVDRVLYSDADPSTGFTIVLDYKWDGKILSNMHALGLVRDSSLTCIRDLNGDHLEMLKNILKCGRKAILEKYVNGTEFDPKVKLQGNQIMAYLHYPPTFYKLHVHFVHVDAADDGGTRAGRAHLLDEVIRNLENDGSYYKNRVLTMFLSKQSKMLKAIEEHNAKCS